MGNANCAIGSVRFENHSPCCCRKLEQLGDEVLSYFCCIETYCGLETKLGVNFLSMDDICKEL